LNNEESKNGDNITTAVKSFPPDNKLQVIVI
jgi:hypothetical protein